MMTLVVYTQYIEGGRPKGGDNYEVVSFRYSDAAAIGNTGMEAIVNDFSSRLIYNDYAREYVIDWELVDHGSAR